MELDKRYEPGRFEPRWAQWWVESGIYQAKWLPDKPVFSLVIPPPNVTGVLHMGHMLEHTEIDVTVRWHRMLGDITLWVPGTDHAGIATEMVVSRQLQAQGIFYRRDLTREQFEKKDGADRRFLRLVARALHLRSRTLPRRSRSLRQPL